MLCAPDLLRAVDNFGMLLLDIVWWVMMCLCAAVTARTWVGLARTIYISVNIYTVYKRHI
jgi:hypothetical protein